MGNVFDKFRVCKSARHEQESTAEILMAYEEYYMRLVKKFRPEIKFISDLHERHTQEVKNFYQSELPAVIKKLEAEPIADDVRREWLKNLEHHIDTSFKMSGDFVNILTTKKFGEFNAALREKTFKGGVR